jgi:hypothetical protein
MRTAKVCPTCATYQNALCTIYNGDTLAISGIISGDSVEAAFIKIEAVLATLTTTSTTTTTTTVV